MKKLLIVALLLNAAFLFAIGQQLSVVAEVGTGAGVEPCDADATKYSLDTNDDGAIDLSDFVYGLSWFFSGTEAPRVCLDTTDLFKTQLRAILRAGAHGNAQILLPMISGLDEVRRARKIIAQPPDPPPPNVPGLSEDDATKLTLRQKLERHRNQKGCAKCHAGIDPWGIPFEQFDAGGLFKQETVDARSTLPDKTEITNLQDLKAYLANDRIDQVAFSFLKHLSSYAIGRSLTYNEIEFLKEKGIELRIDGYRMQGMIQFVIKSPLFLEK